MIISNLHMSHSLQLLFLNKPNPAQSIICKILNYHDVREVCSLTNALTEYNKPLNYREYNLGLMISVYYLYHN